MFLYRGNSSADLLWGKRLVITITLLFRKVKQKLKPFKAAFGGKTMNAFGVI